MKSWIRGPSVLVNPFLVPHIGLVFLAYEYWITNICIHCV